MEKLIQNRAIILFYVIMIGMTFLLLGKLERFQEVKTIDNTVVYVK